MKRGIHPRVYNRDSLCKADTKLRIREEENVPDRLLGVGHRPVVRWMLHGLPEGIPMNWDQIEGQWKQMSGKMREKWGKLTDSDWQQIGGKKDQFMGKLQERYGYSREQAERDFDEWSKMQDRSSKVA